MRGVGSANGACMGAALRALDLPGVACRDPEIPDYEPLAHDAGGEPAAALQVLATRIGAISFAQPRRLARGGFPSSDLDDWQGPDCSRSR